MTYQPVQPTASDEIDALTEDFLEVLLEVEDNYNYPWDITDSHTEAYFTELEDQFSLMESLPEAEIVPPADRFFSQLHQRWSTVDASRVRTSLFRKFGQMVPPTWLETIVEQAHQLAANNFSQLEQQLVECVKPLWGNWVEADLVQFARPLAHAMRGETSIKQAPWQQLSEIQQIRLSMAIAKEAIGELITTEPQ